MMASILRPRKRRDSGAWGCWIGCITAALIISLPLAAQEVELDAIRDSVQVDLENSLQALSDQREQIAAERIPLMGELNEVESEVRALRVDAARLQAVRDSRELGLGDVRAQLQAWENENTYLANLLDEYASRFESSIHVTEAIRFEEATTAYRNSQGQGVAEARLAAQLRLVDNGLERIRSSFGGEQYGGHVVAADGSLIDGAFTRFGPLVYFLDQARQTGGIVNAVDGLNAELYDLDAELDALVSLMNGNPVVVPVDVTEGRATTLDRNRASLMDHIGNGGIWIFPILFFALLSLLISLYKAFQIYRVPMPGMAAMSAILGQVRAGQAESALELARQMPGPVGPMLCRGIEQATQPRELLEELLYEDILDARPRLNRLLPIIATTAAVAPLLGLLGTVTGMINTFNLITLFGTGDARVLSSGISEALVTTEFGLIVAIPSLLVHAVLSRRIKTILGDMEKYALIFSNGVAARVGAGDE